MAQQGKNPKNNKDQAEKFKEAAREVECDESEERFERTLKHISQKKNPEKN